MSTSTPRRTGIGAARVAVAALATLLAVPGCSVGKSSDSGDAAGSNPSASASQSSQSSQPSTLATESPSESPSPSVSIAEGTGDVSQLGDPVASRKGQIDGDPVTLTLFAVRRNGATSSLTFSLAAPARNQGGAQIAQTFDNGKVSSKPNATEDAFTTDGVKLVDGKNSKVYLAASTRDGTCVCSTNLSSTFVTAGTTVLLSTTFADPPADVTQVDVVIPSFGTFSGVPVT